MSCSVWLKILELIYHVYFDLLNISPHCRIISSMCFIFFKYKPKTEFDCNVLFLAMAVIIVDVSNIGYNYKVDTKSTIQLKFEGMWLSCFSGEDYWNSWRWQRQTTGANWRQRLTFSWGQVTWHSTLCSYFFCENMSITIICFCKALYTCTVKDNRCQYKSRQKRQYNP